ECGSRRASSRRTSGASTFQPDNQALQRTRPPHPRPSPPNGVAPLAWREYDGRRRRRAELCRHRRQVIYPVDAPKYKRRTFDEAITIAMARFHAEARQHLTFEQYEYCLTKACLGGGSIDRAWVDRLGYKPDQQLHYEVSIHDWAESELPEAPRPKCWVRILVSRDRSSDFCETWWLPEAKKPRS